MQYLRNALPADFDIGPSTASDVSMGVVENIVCALIAHVDVEELEGAVYKVTKSLRARGVT